MLFSVSDVEDFVEEKDLKFKAMNYLLSKLEIHNPMRTNYYRYHNVYLEELLPGLIEDWLIGKGNVKRILLKRINNETILNAVQGYQDEVDLTRYGGELTKLYRTRINKETGEEEEVPLLYETLSKVKGFDGWIEDIKSFFVNYIKDPLSVEFEGDEIRLYMTLKGMNEKHPELLAMIEEELKKQYNKLKSWEVKDYFDELRDKSEKLTERKEQMLKLYPTGNFSKLLSHVKKNI